MTTVTNIRNARLKKKFTQQQMVQATGLSICTIQSIENGRRTLNLTIVKIAKALGVSVEEFMG